MNRDIRDPGEIGAALETQRAHSASMPVTKLADKIMKDPIRNYGESSVSYAKRVQAVADKNGQQLAIFRAA